MTWDLSDVPAVEANDLSALMRTLIAVSYTHLTLPTTPYV